MSENTEVTAEAGEKTEQEAVEFKAPASQEELDRIITARLDRERKKFEPKLANYDELAAKAARLAEIEEANQSAEEKAAKRLADAEERAAKAELKALRADVATAKGVPANLLTGSTQEELEESADALIAYRGEQKAAPSSAALGRVNGQRVKGSTADQFADFMSSQLNN